MFKFDVLGNVPEIGEVIHRIRADSRQEASARFMRAHPNATIIYSRMARKEAQDWFSEDEE
jgi:hypothetical protein